MEDNPIVWETFAGSPIGSGRTTGLEDRQGRDDRAYLMEGFTLLALLAIPGAFERVKDGGNVTEGLLSKEMTDM